ncbi:MAG: response regulator [Lentisphaerae bacterium]|nr:MAG: response regulator [Lentisphaerota bacterium]
MNEATKKVVLLLDDNAAFRMAFREFLEDEGFTVVEAENIDEALLLVQRYRNDLFLALVDLGLSNDPGGLGWGGLDFIRKVRSFLPQLNIWLMSGNMTKEIEKQLSNEGISRFLLKPIRNLRNLVQEIHQLGITTGI